jgi:hypothetical protein
MATRHDARWLAGVAAGVVVYWWARVLATAEPGPPSFATGDLFGYFLPAYGELRERLRQGTPPWWNPWVGGGVPFAATLQVGAFYPFRLLLLVLEPTTATHWSLVAHLVLAAVATFVLCREIGASRWGAVVGALAYVMPAELPHLYFPPFLEGGAWLPVAGLAACRVIAGGSRRSAVLLGTASAMPLLAGGYQTAVYAAYGTTLLGAIQLAGGMRRESWPRLARRLLLAALVAAALVAPQLCLTLAWSAEAARTTGALTDQQIQPYWHPSLVPVVVRLVLLQLVTTDGALNTLYLSLPVVLLAAVGVATHGRRGALLGAAAILFLLLCLGPGLPWFALYHWLPGLDWFRLPQRLSVLLALFAALAAALGTTTLGRAAEAGRARLPRWIEAAAAALVVGALVVPARNRWSLPWTVPRAQRLLGADVFDAAKAVVGGGRLWVPGTALGLGMGAFPRLGLATGTRVLQDYEPLSSRRLGRYLYAAGGETPPADPAAAPFTGAVAGTVLAAPALLDAAAVTGIVLPAAQAAPAGARWQAAGTVRDFRVWRNPAALPRAYVVTGVRQAESDEAALALMVAPGFDPSREVVLAGAGPDAAPGAASRPVRAQAIVADEPEHVRVRLDAPAPGVLVVTDAYAPGWRASVDGVERPLRLANAFGRGVRVGPGDRQVDFTYHPPGLWLGASVSVVAAACAMLLGIGLRERR